MHMFTSFHCNAITAVTRHPWHTLHIAAQYVTRTTDKLHVHYTAGDTCSYDSIIARNVYNSPVGVFKTTSFAVWHSVVSARMRATIHTHKFSEEAWASAKLGK
jgi:hypothetical protein